MGQGTNRLTNTFPPSTELSLNVLGGEGMDAFEGLEEEEGGEGLHRTTMDPSILHRARSIQRERREG